MLTQCQKNLTGLSFEMAVDTYSVMRRSDRMGEVVFGVWGWILGKSGLGGYFARLPDLLLIKRGRTRNPVQLHCRGDHQRRRRISCGVTP